MAGMISEDEHRRIREYTKKPRYERTPDMLLPDAEDEDADEE